MTPLAWTVWREALRRWIDHWRAVYRAERAHPEWVDLGGES